METQLTESLAVSQKSEREVHLEITYKPTQQQFTKLTDSDLIHKAKAAVDYMGLYGSTKPASFQILSVRWVRNRRIIYKLESVQSAKWLRAPETVQEFAKQFNTYVLHSPAGFAIIVENVPTTYEPRYPEGARLLEELNRLPVGSIISYRWIKPLEWRYDRQASAHLICALDMADTANDVIDDGIKIEEHHSTARKLLIEPRRCAKCQRHTNGHMAADCKELHDTCANCAGWHRTSTCKEKDPRNYRCANCISMKQQDINHAAWDKQCPIYERRKAWLDLWFPGNKYKYYPTTDPKMWERLDQPAPTRTAHQLPHRPEFDQNIQLEQTHAEDPV